MSTAKDIMTRDPVTCQETDPVYRAVEIMKRRDTGVVPIVDSQGRCCGVITDRDICLDVILRNLDPRTTQLRELMHTDLVICSPDDPVETTLEKMKRKQVKRILVVDQDERVVGIISESDIARRLDARTMGTLAESVYS